MGAAWKAATEAEAVRVAASNEADVLGPRLRPFRFLQGVAQTVRSFGDLEAAPAASASQPLLVVAST